MPLPDRQTQIFPLDGNFVPFSPFGDSYFMKQTLVQDALKTVQSPQVLVNIISKRVRQLGQGFRPLVAFDPKLTFMDVALKEVAEGKLGYEMIEVPSAAGTSLTTLLRRPEEETQDGERQPLNFSFTRSSDNRRAVGCFRSRLEVCIQLGCNCAAWDRDHKLLVQPENCFAIPQQAQFLLGVDRLRSFLDQAFTQVRPADCIGGSSVAGRALPHERKMHRLHIRTQQGLHPERTRGCFEASSAVIIVRGPAVPAAVSVSSGVMKSPHDLRNMPESGPLVIQARSGASIHPAKIGSSHQGKRRYPGRLRTRSGR